MKDIMQAVNKALVNVFPQAKVFMGAAVGNPSSPYIVYRHNGSTIDTYNTCHLTYGYIVTHNIQIQAIGDTMEEVLDATEEFKDYLHDGNLVLIDHNFTKVELVSQDILEDTEREPDGGKQYISTVIFEYTLTRKQE